METRSKRINVNKWINESQLSDDACSFRIRDLSSLNIIFKDVNSDLEILKKLSSDIKVNDYNLLFMKNINKMDILNSESNDIKKRFNNKELSVINYLKEVVENDPLKFGVNESLVNNFINYLLCKLEFNENPLSLKLEEKYKFNIKNKIVTAKIEFTVSKNNSIVCLDEDKHITGVSKSTEFGECQIAAEILACAYTNYQSAKSITKGKDQTIYAIRIIGFRFTFYKAIINKKYIEELDYGFPDSSFTIFKFPSESNREYGYDYTDVNDRYIIIELLLRLRENL
jgi:hypothetical protein